MSNNDIFNAINFKGVFKKSASKAGQRYSVFQSPEMPNVKLKYINYLNALTLNSTFVENIKSSAKNIEEYNYQSNKLESKKISNLIDPILQHLYETIQNITIDITNLYNLHELKLFLEKTIEIVGKRRNTHSVISHTGTIEKRTKEHCSYLSTKYRDLANSLYKLKEEFDYFVDSFVGNPYMLVIGEAGIGKTHFMLDSTKTLLEEDNCALTFLGEIFKNDISIIDTIRNELGLEIDNNELLTILNEKANSNNTRFLIIIDAVNEIDISAEVIKNKLDDFISLVKEFENLSVVFSCRTPYQLQVIPDISDYFVFTLPGLPQEEALKQFSKAFNIQPIELPYIVNELSNPLFLKTMYETITLEKNRDDSVQVSSLLSKGNESLKELFEKYIFEHSIHIFKHKKHRFLLWKNIIKPICELNFESLQKNKQYELTEEDVLSVIESGITQEILSYAGIENKYSLLNILVNVGIFRRDIDYGSGQEIIKVTYQKLYDFLMARYIFEVMPKKRINSKEEIAAAYETLISNFKYFSFLEAIIVEFPTRNEQDELFDYLSEDFLNQYGSNLLEIFIDGLLWRDHRSFTDRTKYYINQSLQNNSDTTLETLFILSTKPNHPFTKKTFSFLEEMSMKQRDLILSQFLRYRIDSDNPIGLYIEWLHEHDKSRLEKIYIYNLFNYLLWFLTLPINAYRDKVTHTLVDLGTNDLETMFAFIRDKHDVINDDYIRERLIGSLYGAMMRLQLIKSHYKLFHEISLWLDEKYFINFTTYHIIILDYIKSIIELSSSKNIYLQIDVDKVLKFQIEKQDNFWRLPSYTKCKDFLKSTSFHIDPMHMDFTNYTVGGLFKHRGNYSHTKEYNIAVLSINNRIYELGWNESDFEDIDREYNSSYGGRIGTHSIERYGKKYSWIAYYEYIGYLISIGTLDPREDDYEEIEYDRFWEKTLDVSFPDMEQFINKKPFIEILSFDNLKAQLITDDWIVIFAYVRDKDQKQIEYLINTSFTNEKRHFNSLGQNSTPFMGELFWSENLINSGKTDLCVNYSSGDYNTYYSSEYNFVSLSKEFARVLNISIDLKNCQFIDSNGRKAIQLYKYSDNSQIQEFTLLRKDLLQRYMKLNKLKLFYKLDKTDFSHQENDKSEIIAMDWKEIEIQYWLQKLYRYIINILSQIKKKTRMQYDRNK